MPEPVAGGDGATYRVTFDRLGAKTPIEGARLRVTLAAGGKAVEQTVADRLAAGCPGSIATRPFRRNIRYEESDMIKVGDRLPEGMFRVKNDDGTATEVSTDAICSAARRSCWSAFRAPSPRPATTPISRSSSPMPPR